MQKDSKMLLRLRSKQVFMRKFENTRSLSDDYLNSVSRVKRRYKDELDASHIEVLDYINQFIYAGELYQGYLSEAQLDTLVEIRETLNEKASGNYSHKELDFSKLVEILGVDGDISAEVNGKFFMVNISNCRALEKLQYGDVSNGYKEISGLKSSCQRGASLRAIVTDEALAGLQESLPDGVTILEEFDR